MNKDYINWDTYFMAVALLSAKRSKDPVTTVGACLVSPDKKIIGVGYNGLPAGINDHEFTWDNRLQDIDSKYLYVVHAELNAILNSTRDLKGATLYVTLFPCNECAKALIQAGVVEIIYLEDKYHDEIMFIASRRMLDKAGIAYRQFSGQVKELVL